MAYNESITHEELLARLNYDPNTGEFTRILPSQGCRVGDIAGSVSPYGYVQIVIKGGHYLGHRLAWFYVNKEWPPERLDHINNNRSDNRISNLRLANKYKNSQNTKLRSDNKSGYKGVHKVKNRELWKSVIYVNNVSVSLGYFKTPEEAHAAYCRAAEQHFGEFANFGQSQSAEEILRLRQALARR